MYYGSAICRRVNPRMFGAEGQIAVPSQSSITMTPLQQAALNFSSTHRGQSTFDQIDPSALAFVTAYQDANPYPAPQIYTSQPAGVFAAAQQILTAMDQQQQTAMSQSGATEGFLPTFVPPRAPSVDGYFSVGPFIPTSKKVARGAFSAGEMGFGYWLVTRSHPIFGAFFLLSGAIDMVTVLAGRKGSWWVPGLKA